MFYLSFSEAKTLKLFWSHLLQLEKFIRTYWNVLRDRDLWHKITIPAFWEGNISIITITWLFLTGNHLFWSPFLILSIAKFLRAPILKNICEWLLLKICSWTWEKFKIIHDKNFTLKTLFQHQYQKQVHDSYFLIGSPWRLYSHTIFLWCGWCEINSKH